jgi:hypothetical protein
MSASADSPVCGDWSQIDQHATSLGFSVVLRPIPGRLPGTALRRQYVDVGPNYSIICGEYLTALLPPGKFQIAARGQR